MKGKDNKEGEHCKEVREILETPPSWIIRWGTLVITVVLITTVLIIWLWFF